MPNDLYVTYMHMTGLMGDFYRHVSEWEVISEYRKLKWKAIRLFYDKMSAPVDS